MKFIMLLIGLLPLWADDDGIPVWVLNGIAKVETHSYWRDGKFVYVDQKRGTHGERGPFQMMPATFDLIKKRGEYFSWLSYDTDFALNITIRYLLYLYDRCHSWERAVAAYNGGPGNPQWEYLRQVKDAGLR